MMSFHSLLLIFSFYSFLSFYLFVSIFQLLLFILFVLVLQLLQLRQLYHHLSNHEINRLLVLQFLDIRNRHHTGKIRVFTHILKVTPIKGSTVDIDTGT